ncbi:MAG: MotA/TolQ/ExbB proton channel family protein [Deltaproteobacteria bacterium]|nr:MAG: MotA/TolQ/ExbB proton channel family protein [Deltaproteobacteria bacterium]
MNHWLHHHVWEPLSHLVEVGGFITLPLLAVGLLVSYLLALRMYDLYALRFRLPNTLQLTGIPWSSRDLEPWFRSQAESFDSHQWLHIENELLLWEAQLRRSDELIQSLVTAAPLLGLLGTVSGMILTFDSLASTSLLRQGNGIAGGISEALLTTQLGLVIAIPAMLAQQMIQRWRQRWHQRVMLLLQLCQSRTGHTS